jgi:hypothetical protein
VDEACGEWDARCVVGGQRTGSQAREHSVVEAVWRVIAALRRGGFQSVVKKGSMAVERRRFVVGLGERGPRIRFPAGWSWHLAVTLELWDGVFQEAWIAMEASN